MLAMAVLCVLLQGGEEAPVRAVLERQVAAWNRGGLDAFLSTYVDSPELTFTGRDGVTRGYAEVAGRYKKRYATREAMGTLRFDEIGVKMLGGEAALVLGRFKLDRSEAGGGAASGRFTLVLRKTKAGWKIVHDHTS